MDTETEMAEQTTEQPKTGRRAWMIGAAVAMVAIVVALVVQFAGSASAVSRDSLLALLWPESDEQRARDALKQLVRALRRTLGTLRPRWGRTRADREIDRTGGR